MTNKKTEVSFGFFIEVLQLLLLQCDLIFIPRIYQF